MARASWGGGADYSSLFAQLYNQQANEQTTQNNLAKEQQAAADADMIDQWNNGLVDADTFLAYLQQRADETESDPSEHEKWTKAVRQYTVAISDSEADFAYQNGGSINDYIAYWQDRVKTMAPDSNEYRTTVTKINTLLDTRAQNDVVTGANKINKQIQDGTASYQDLLKFYQSKLPSIRGDSDLYKQVQDQITSVQAQIKNGQIQGEYNRIDYEYNAGKISGAQAGAQLRALANKYFANDPEQFYKVLNSAVQYEKAGAKAAKGGGGGGSGSAAASKAALDLFQATESQLNGLVDQYKSGATQGFDPWTGQTIQFSDAQIDAINKAQLKNYDGWTAYYKAKGDASAAMNTQGKKTDFILKTVQPFNTENDAENFQQFLLSATQRVQLASQLPDPTATLNEVDSIARQVGDYARGLATQTTLTGVSKPNVEGRAAPTYGTTALAPELRPTGEYLEELTSLQGALTLLAQKGVPREQVEAFLKSAIGKNIPDATVNQLVKVAIEQNQQATELATGDRVYFVGEKGIGTVKQKTVTVPVVTANGVAMQDTKVPDVQVDYKNGESTTTVYMTINGVPTPVMAVVKPYTGYQTYLSQGISNLNVGGKTYNLPKGAAIPDAMLATLGADGLKALIDKGQAKLGTIDVGLNYVSTPAYTDGSGKSYAATTWLIDAQTGVAHQIDSNPLQYVKIRPDGTVAIDDTTNQPIANFMPFSTGGGVPVIFVGDTEGAKKMQDLWNSGMAGANVRTRGLDGQVTEVPGHDFSSAYYWQMPGTPTLASGRDNWWDPQEQDALREYLAGQAAQSYVSNQQWQATGSAPNQGILSAPYGSGISNAINSILSSISKPAAPAPAPAPVNATTPTQNISPFTGFNLTPPTTPQVSTQTGFNLAGPYSLPKLDVPTPTPAVVYSGNTGIGTPPKPIIPLPVPKPTLPPSGGTRSRAL